MIDLRCKAWRYNCKGFFADLQVYLNHVLLYIGKTASGISKYDVFFFSFLNMILAAIYIICILLSLTVFVPSNVLPYQRIIYDISLRSLFQLSLTLKLIKMMNLIT